jgi:hypothetical protein
MGSGGMPSSHAAAVMGVAASICLKEGPESSLFAIAMVLATVVITPLHPSWLTLLNVIDYFSYRVESMMYLRILLL